MSPQTDGSYLRVVNLQTTVGKMIQTGPKRISSESKNSRFVLEVTTYLLRFVHEKSSGIASIFKGYTDGQDRFAR